MRVNGLVYEAFAAWHGRRERRDLYHSALILTTDRTEYTVEMTPIRAADGPVRGVVAEGPVGSALLRRFKLFRYEVRVWASGVIPDIDEAVDSPQLLSEELAVAQRMLDLAPQIPPLVWGRDELHTGEMWNSNSLISWLVVRSGLDVDAVRMPANGRAPGWDAGIVVARRQA